MGVRLNVIALLSSIALFACGGASHSGGEAKGPEKDPWAGYKGTYATASGASGSPSARIKSARENTAKTEAAQTEAPKEAPVEVADETPAAAPTPTPAPAKKAKTAAKAAKKKKPTP